MLKDEILEKLIYFTEEEMNNLNGMETIDKSIFLDEDSHIIDCY